MSKQRLASLDLSNLKKVKPKDLGIRFVFGAAIAVIAGIVSLSAGSKAGGPLLAFPAILPATLTLIEKDEGEEKTVHDLQGSVVGAIGMCSFAVVAAVLLGKVAVGIAILAAFGAWALTAGVIYLLWASWLRDRGVKL